MVTVSPDATVCFGGTACEKPPTCYRFPVAKSLKFNARESNARMERSQLRSEITRARCRATELSSTIYRLKSEHRRQGGDMSAALTQKISEMSIERDEMLAKIEEATKEYEYFTQVFDAHMKGDK